MRKIILLLAVVFSAQTFAASRKIMVTGFWPPTNDMLRRLSANPVQNPEGWQGANWQGSGYDVYAYFPDYPHGGSIGEGDFRVDYAATFNDFMRYTKELKPIAIVSFGLGTGPWEIEAVAKNAHRRFYEEGNIPSDVGEKVLYPIPDELKQDITYLSSLPLQKILEGVNALGRPGLRAWIDDQGAGSAQCAFLSYLLGWYHDRHQDLRDPAYNRMAGFIHVGVNQGDAEIAVQETLKAIVEELGLLR